MTGFIQWVKNLCIVLNVGCQDLKKFLIMFQYPLKDLDFIQQTARISKVMELVTLENSDEQLYTHPDFACTGQSCTIHNRSNHSMRSFPQHWRTDLAIMERICSHGLGHPDPDEYKLNIRHDCDGCCEVTNASL